MTSKKTAEQDSLTEQASPAPNGPENPTVHNATEQADTPGLQSLLEAAQREAVENLDKFLRAKAEVENIRRRGEIDVANAHKFAIERFAQEMLAVKDSLELARAVDIQAGGPAITEKMIEGLDLTLKLMDSIFEKFTLVAVSPQKGEKFDPEKHQAMSLQAATDVPPNHVLLTVQKGYTLNNRLLRPAMVIVTKAEENRAPGQPPEKA